MNTLAMDQTERDTGREFNGDTLVELLSFRSRIQPDELLYRFDEPGAKPVTRTFRELYRRAQGIAAYLQKNKMSGERALMLYPAGMDFIDAFFGCLFAGTIAVPASPPASNRMVARLEEIIRDADASMILTNRSVLKRLQQLNLLFKMQSMPIISNLGDILLSNFGLSRSMDFGKLPTVPTDQLPSETDSVEDRPSIDGDTLAFLQYTSGSTSAPKGVMVSHRNLLANEEMIRRAFGHDESAIQCSWLPQFHDMGLIGMLLQPLYLGTPCYSISPQEFIRNPLKWLQMITEHRVTSTGSPNFGFDLCVNRVSDADKKSLNLSSLKVLYNGAEPVRHGTLKAFAEAFRQCGFDEKSLLPVYGLAESTLLVTASKLAQEPTTTAFSAAKLENGKLVQAIPDEEEIKLVACGTPASQSEVLIVDPETQMPLEDGAVGEIWVRGDHVGSGYWRNEQSTRETFQAKIAGSEKSYLRTGDLGAIFDGQIYITGRIKDVIIINGKNYYPQDLELTAESSHRGLRKGCVAAFALEKGGSEKIVIAQEIRDNVDSDTYDEIVHSVCEEINAVHHLPVHAVALLKARTIPKTASGKIQRAATRSELKSGVLTPVHYWISPRDDVRADTRSVASVAPEADQIGIRFIQEIAAVLKLDPSSIDLKQSVASLGLDSLSLVNLLVALEEEFGTSFPEELILESNPTIGEAIERLAEQIKPADLRAERSFPTRAGKAEPERFKASNTVANFNVPEFPRDASGFYNSVNPFIARLLKDLDLDKRFVKALGSMIEDADGNRYLDFIAQYGALPFGHNPPEIWNAVSAVRDSAEPNFVQPSILDAAGTLAERLIRLAPHMGQVTFSNSGAEAVEAAIKLCRARKQREGILTTKNSFHGKTFGALSATGKSKYQSPFFAPGPGFDYVPFGEANAVREQFEANPGKYAAFLVEPIQGEGGIVVPPDDYLAQMQQLCREHDVLLVVDEIQTGLGRTGDMLVSVAQGVEADVITVAKALGGGIIPIAATLSKKNVYSEDFGMLHSSTFAGNALASRIGIATLDLLEADDAALLRNVRKNADRLRNGLNALKDKYPKLIREIRGRGYLLGVQFHVGPHTWPKNLLGYLAEQGFFALLFCSYLLNEERIRLATALNGSDIVRIEPSLNIGKQEIETFLAGFDRALAQFNSGDTGQLVAHLIGSRTGKPIKAFIETAQPRAPARQEFDGHRFGFLVHPLTLESYRDMDPNLRGFSNRQLQSLSERMRSHVEPFVVGETEIVSRTGARAWGQFVAVPMLANDFVTPPMESGLEAVESAIEKLLDADVNIIGLGGYTSVATQGGYLLDVKLLPAITSGNSYTAVSGYQAVVELMRRYDVRQHESCGLVVGASGSVGSASALLLARSVARLVLVGNPSHPEASISRMRQIALTIVEDLIARAGSGTSFKEGTLGHRTNLLVEGSDDPTHEGLLQELIDTDRIVLSTDLTRWTRQSQVVVTATSTVDSLITESNISAGTIVCDLSRPSNVNSAVKTNPDYRYAEGGVVKIPGSPDVGFSFGLPIGQAYACMAETMILALEGQPSGTYRETGRMGNLIFANTVNPAFLSKIGRLADRHGFGLVL